MCVTIIYYELNGVANSDVSQLDLAQTDQDTILVATHLFSPRRDLPYTPLWYNVTSQLRNLTLRRCFRTTVYSRAPPSAPPQTISRKDAHVPTQLHHGVVARATEDSTLAVIPAEAFRRLTKKFPKATGHIVQGKLLRVVMITWLPAPYNSDSYTIFARNVQTARINTLVWPPKFFALKKAINDIACHPLPASFYEGGGLQYLRQPLWRNAWIGNLRQTTSHTCHLWENPLWLDQSCREPKFPIALYQYDRLSDLRHPAMKYKRVISQYAGSQWGVPASYAHIQHLEYSSRCPRFNFRDKRRCGQTVVLRVFQGMILIFETKWCPASPSQLGCFNHR